MTINNSNLYDLWEHYYPKVYGYFLRRLNNKQDVEDLTSLVLTYFLEKITTKEINSPNAFLWKIAHNQLCLFIRNKSKEPLMISIQEEFLFVGFDPDVENTKSDYLESKLKNLEKCIQNQLDKENYFIVNQIIINDKKAVDVAFELGLKADTVRQKLKRALDKIRKNCKTIWQNA